MYEDMSIYFSGEKLYGDDFTPNQIEEWYKDEQEVFRSIYLKKLLWILVLQYNRKCCVPSL